MNGEEHYRRAEELAAEAGKLLGHGDGQATAATWAAVAQVHATLAVAAAMEARSGAGSEARSSAGSEARSSAGSEARSGAGSEARSGAGSDPADDRQSG